MKNASALILDSLASSHKSRLEISCELGLPPSTVAGVLTSLISGGEVEISGKVNIHETDVSVYALADRRGKVRDAD